MNTASAAHSQECLTESRAVRIVAADLASVERHEVEDHLAACSVCRLMMSEVLHGSVNEPPARQFRPRVLAPGMILSDRYRICRFLGMGAMGEVHQAEDLLLGKAVAVKTLNARLLGSDKAVARLKLEVAAAHRVTNPNVCRIFDIGIDCRDVALGPLMFITMEFLEGPTLASLLSDPALTDPERAAILRQLANGLSAAHAAEVIHRDFKPENVIVTRQPGGTIRAVITDFGLAGLGDSTESGEGSGLSGTPAYAAPERLLGAPATPASDVYSFGLVGLEVLRRGQFVGAEYDTRGLPLPWRGVIRRALESQSRGAPPERCRRGRGAGFAGAADDRANRRRCRRDNRGRHCVHGRHVCRSSDDGVAWAIAPAARCSHCRSAGCRRPARSRRASFCGAARERDKSAPRQANPPDGAAAGRRRAGAATGRRGCSCPTVEAPAQRRLFRVGQTTPRGRSGQSVLILQRSRQRC